MLCQLCLAGAAVASLTSAAQVSNTSAIWVTEVPSYVRPYAIQPYSARGNVVGQQIYRFPVTDPSSDYTFTLISTDAPTSTELGVFPHRHQRHYENFCNLRGRFQLVYSESRHGDVGVISPGGFEVLFYAPASANYTSPSFSPYNPSIEAGPTATPDDDFLQVLKRFDVYVQNYTARSDAVDGAASAGSVWHTSSSLGNDSSTPFFVAKDYGPQYLNNQTGGYKVIQPFVTPVQSGNFALSTITMARIGVADVTESVYPGHAAFEVLDGQLMILIGEETLSLLQGDVLFIPGNTSYKYFSDVARMKFLHISQGAVALDSALIAGGVSWDSPVWPIS